MVTVRTIVWIVISKLVSWNLHLCLCTFPKIAKMAHFVAFLEMASAGEYLVYQS
jgi:hypothetical protein